MLRSLAWTCSVVLAFDVVILPAQSAELILHIRTPMAPPAWALLERELLRANTAACQQFFAKYFDERGYLMCVERWGGDDGPDDAIENCTNWPVLHALGAPDVIRELYEKAWEGHLRQYTHARTTQVPFARDGMYYKEFPVMFDWLHNGEGLTVFNLQGLSNPNDTRFQQRVRRYAGFYLNEDPGAPNYDPHYKIIRSMFNGSRGPLLRKATALDWTGDPIEVAGRFRLGHGERSYEEMLAHFKDYTDIVGDHPQNLRATTLALNAYLLTHDPKYKSWLLEYVDAWRQRMIDNGGIIPTNVGLDGKIGSAAGGKWYGGVYGWAFSVLDPARRQVVHRNLHHLGLQGFGNAFLLTGDDRYLEPWRGMIDLVNRQGKTSDGRTVYPHMYGDRGWYDFTPAKYSRGTEEIWYWSMADPDLKRLGPGGWMGYLQGTAPNYPQDALQQDFATIRRKVAGFQADTTTPDTRLADDPLPFNPASVGSLIRLMLGGLPPGNSGSVLHCRLRYFDAVKRRAGIPDDVAALVEKLTANSTVLTLVNLNQIEPRLLIAQAGGYGEHQWTAATCNGRTINVEAPWLLVRLEPGAGARLVLGTQRYVHQPALAHPWDPERVPAGKGQ
jgi:hypothetical protein